MKKPILFLLMIALTVSLYACRPRAEEDILISAPEKQTPTASTPPETEPKPETKQDTEQKSLDAEPDAKAEQTAVKDAEEFAEIQQDGIKYFVETKDGVEWKVPEEDPALRAEAEKLRKINWNLYASFCADHDLQYSYDTTADDKMANDTILITLKHCCSEAGKIAPPFEKYVDFVSITERTFAKTPEDFSKLRDEAKQGFNQFFMIKVEPTSNEALLDMVHQLEKLPYVLTAYVNAPQVIHR